MVGHCIGRTDMQVFPAPGLARIILSQWQINPKILHTASSIPTGSILGGYNMIPQRHCMPLTSGYGWGGHAESKGLHEHVPDLLSLPRYAGLGLFVFVIACSPPPRPTGMVGRD